MLRGHLPLIREIPLIHRPGSGHRASPHRDEDINTHVQSLNLLFLRSLRLVETSDSGTGEQYRAMATKSSKEITPAAGRGPYLQTRHSQLKALFSCWWDSRVSHGVAHTPLACLLHDGWCRSGRWSGYSLPSSREIPAKETGTRP